MKRLTSFLCLMLPFAAAVSCIRDSYENCPPTPTRGELLITFDMLNPTLSYTEEKLVRLDLYFYDMTGTPTRAGEPTPGNLVTILTYDVTGLVPETLAALVEGVEPGDYHLLAIFNTSDVTPTSDTETYEGIHTSLNSDRLDFAPPADFLTGEYSFTVTGDEQVQNLTLLRHNNDITLNVQYQGYELPDGSALGARIYGNNGAFDYSEHATPEDSFITSYDWAQKPGTDPNLPLDFSLTTMRLCHEREMTLYLEELPATGTRAEGDPTNSVSVDMMAALLEATDEEGNKIFDTDDKLERFNSYDFKVTLSADFTVVSVTVETSDWDRSGGNVEI